MTAQLLNDLACNEPDAERALPALEVSLIARASKALSNWWDDTESNIYVVAKDGNRSSVTTPRVQVAVAEEGTKPFVEQGDDGPGLRRRGSCALRCRFAGLPTSGGRGWPSSGTVSHWHLWRPRRGAPSSKRSVQIFGLHAC